MTSELLVYSEKRELLEELVCGGRTLATQLGLTVGLVVIGDADPPDIERLAGLGADRVYVGTSPHLVGLDVESVAGSLWQISQQSSVSVILIGSTRRGKELAGRLAQKLEAGCITDANSLSVRDGKLVAERCALGGNTISTEMLKSTIQVFSVRPRIFEVSRSNHEAAGEIMRVDLDLSPPRTRVVEQRTKSTEQVDLEQADVVVAAGRGVQKEVDLELPRGLAAVLGGELGCTRSLCSDYGWLSEERMIGISGKTCRANLLVSVGASGQIQHAVGIRDSKILVAINNDESAPIFQSADYGIVGDLYEVLPKFVDELNRRATA